MDTNLPRANGIGLIPPFISPDTGANHGAGIRTMAAPIASTPPLGGAVDTTTPGIAVSSAAAISTVLTSAVEAPTSESLSIQAFTSRHDMHGACGVWWKGSDRCCSRQLSCLRRQEMQEVMRRTEKAKEA
jgi:hypothetical protein